MRTATENLRAMNVIDHARTERASSVVFAPKKDGALSFCVNYRELNAVIIPDWYLLPRVDESIDSLRETQVFSTLDANCGYCQIEVDTLDIEKTSLTSHHGSYMFTCLPPRLKNALPPISMWLKQYCFESVGDLPLLTMTILSSFWECCVNKSIIGFLVSALLTRIVSL